MPVVSRRGAYGIEVWFTDSTWELLRDYDVLIRLYAGSLHGVLRAAHKLT